MTAAGSVFLVVPCFRESGRIGCFLPGLCREIDRLDGGSRILVVEDGSDADEQAKMRAIIDELSKTHPSLLPLMELPRNLGKGGAIYEGWGAHGGQSHLGFVDADGSCPAEEASRLTRAAFENPGKCVIASRMRMPGHRVERRLDRHVLGRIYAAIVSQLLGISIRDTQCGLKIVPRAAFEKARPVLTIRGFSFDAQLIAALLDSGCGVIEEPIDWHETPGGKLRLLRDSIRMLGELLRIRRERASESWQALAASAPAEKQP